ncbi:hypothetical protein V8E53_013393 [Lactarius tabidus]
MSLADNNDFVVEYNNSLECNHLVDEPAPSTSQITSSSSFAVSDIKQLTHNDLQHNAKFMRVSCSNWSHPPMWLSVCNKDGSMITDAEWKSIHEAAALVACTCPEHLDPSGHLDLGQPHKKKFFKCHFSTEWNAMFLELEGMCPLLSLCACAGCWKADAILSMVLGDLPDVPPVPLTLALSHCSAPHFPLQHPPLTPWCGLGRTTAKCLQDPSPVPPKGKKLKGTKHFAPLGPSADWLLCPSLCPAFLLMIEAGTRPNQAESVPSFQAHPCPVCQVQGKAAIAHLRTTAQIWIPTKRGYEALWAELEGNMSKEEEDKEDNNDGAPAAANDPLAATNNPPAGNNSKDNTDDSLLRIMPSRHRGDIIKVITTTPNAEQPRKEEIKAIISECKSKHNARAAA